MGVSTTIKPSLLFCKPLRIKGLAKIGVLSKRRILVKKGDFIAKKGILKDKKRDIFDWNNSKSG